MGMFPYVCMYCGGGYSRCGKDHEGECQNQYCDHDDEENCDIRCSGGQFCWEEKCYIIPCEEQEFKKDWTSLEPIYASYKGYGTFELKSHKNIVFADIGYKQYIDCWELDKKNVVLVNVACKSCYLAKNKVVKRKREKPQKSAKKVKFVE